MNIQQINDGYKTWKEAYERKIGFEFKLAERLITQAAFAAGIELVTNSLNNEKEECDAEEQASETKRYE